MLRNLTALLAFALALPLAASAQTATGLQIQPVVVVYPFASSTSSIDREASSRLATIIATGVANTHRVRVLPATPGTERKDYLTAARAVGADYYVSGFITPLGSGVSIVEQVVSAQTGIVLFSNSAQLDTYADAAGQGDTIGNFVFSHANRGMASIQAPPPAPAPTATSVGEAAQAKLGSLFKGKKGKATAAPKATAEPKPSAAATAGATRAPLVTPPTAPALAVAPPTAAPTAPPTAAGNAVGILVEGSVPAFIRDITATHLAAQLGSARNAKRIDATVEAVRAHDGSVCRTNGLREIVVAHVDIRNATATARIAGLELTAFDCNGASVYSVATIQRRGGDAHSAVFAAVDAAAAVYDMARR